jgi:hypothetical protein
MNEHEKTPAGPEVWRAFRAINRDARPYPDPRSESGWQSRNVTSVCRMNAG